MFKAPSEFLALAFSGWELKWKGVINNQKGEWWLLSQLLVISAHLLPTWPSLNSFGLVWLKIFTIAGTCLFFLGMVLAAKALLSLGASLSPLPYPKTGAKLVRESSYKSCRHPLYQALLISSVGVMVTLGSMLHLFLFIILCSILIGKAKKEEHQLKVKHLEYIHYLKKTPAIFQGIPFLDWRT